MRKNVPTHRFMPWEVPAVRRLSRLIYPAIFRPQFFPLAMNPTAKDAAAALYRRRLNRAEKRSK